MDIYLKDTTLEIKRKDYNKTFRKYVGLRNKARNKQEQARYQKEVEKWDEKMYSSNMGYFRVSYNDYSLSYWLMYNVDPRAKAEWGIEPFYSAVQGKKEPIITDVSFHKELLKMAQCWYDKACKLEGKPSILNPTDYKKSDFEKDKWVKKMLLLKPEQTDSYIEWLKELVDFAELAVKTKAPIEVWA